MTIKKEQFDVFVENLCLGLTITDSAKLAGIALDTYYAWEKNNQERWDICQQAILQPKINCVKIIHKAKFKSWQAAAWWLERKHKDEFSLQTTLVGDKNNPVIVKFSDDDKKL